MSRTAPDPTYWMPVRFVSHEQECDLCWAIIPKASPGRSTGTRGTKAWYNAAFGIWECIKCRQLVTPELVADRHTPIPREIESCQACDYRRLSTDVYGLAPFFALAICPGCALGDGRGFHRTCPRCGHVEHRSHASRRREAFQ